MDQVFQKLLWTEHIRSTTAVNVNCIMRRLKKKGRLAGIEKFAKADLNSHWQVLTYKKQRLA